MSKQTADCICPHCGFPFKARRKDQTQCGSESCRRAASRLRTAAWRRADPERARQCNARGARRYREKNPETYLDQKHRAYLARRDRNPDVFRAKANANARRYRDKLNSIDLSILKWKRRRAYETERAQSGFCERNRAKALKNYQKRKADINGAFMFMATFFPEDLKL